jgi:hypothetical protein
MLKATLSILYSSPVPEVPGDTFVELRRWLVPPGGRQELILETGMVTNAGELLTSAQVLPFHLSVEDALAVAGVQSEPVTAYAVQA